MNGLLPIGPAYAVIFYSPVLLALLLLGGC